VPGLCFARGRGAGAYPDYRRAVPDEDGRWHVPDARLARRHRANIGTIVSDASMTVQYLGGAKLGQVEESFAARLKPGDCFLFGGRLLELVRVREMTAWVKRASGRRPAVPRWNGGACPCPPSWPMPLWRSWRRPVRGLRQPGTAGRTAPAGLQQRWSALPGRDTLLAEVLRSREGTHLFLYPFAGRHVHLGLASLLAWRVAQPGPQHVFHCVNDYGFELLSATAGGLGADPARALQVQPDDDATLLHELLDSLNASELAQRRFPRNCPRGGPDLPEPPRRAAQQQATAGLVQPVLGGVSPVRPGNRLLAAGPGRSCWRRSWTSAACATLHRLARQVLALHPIASGPRPFAFPLMVERLREKLSNESVADRIARMVAQLEKAAGGRT
jgi:ATP-dependent helicase Lhr and Lhr-like helicase